MKVLVLNCGSSSLKYQLINMEYFSDELPQFNTNIFILHFPF